jgi:hypothetical protein
LTPFHESVDHPSATIFVGIVTKYSTKEAVQQPYSNRGVPDKAGVWGTVESSNFYHGAEAL